MIDISSLQTQENDLTVTLKEPQRNGLKTVVLIALIAIAAIATLFAILSGVGACAVIPLSVSITIASLSVVAAIAVAFFTSSSKKPLLETCTSSRKALSGETLYFVMERLDTQESRERWSAYGRACKTLAFEHNGLLALLGKAKDDPDRLQRLQQDERIDLKGEAFDNLMEKLRRREIYPGGKRWKSFTGIEQGIAGFHPNDCTFVAYISKKPITGRASIPREIPEKLTKIFDAYQDIVMSVGVTLVEGKPLFKNRGIARNPISVLDGGYSRVSTLLHGFTGKMVQTLINRPLPPEKRKKYMTVSPLKVMEEMLITAIGRQHIQIDKEILQELRCYEFGSDERPLLIPLERVVALYSEEIKSS